MKNLRILPAMLIAMAWSVGAQAQGDDFNDSHTITIDVPAVLLVDIEPSANKNITIGYVAPTEAGNPIVADDPDETLWLNYSFIPTEEDVTAKITVVASDVIAGMDINLEAAAHNGTGGGTFGTPVGEITLTTSAQDFITGIEASWTGNGNTNGHQLTYSLDVSNAANYADLFATASTVVTVTYTIEEE